MDPEGVQLHPGDHLNPHDDTADVSRYGGRPLPEPGDRIPAPGRDGTIIRAEGGVPSERPMRERRAERLASRHVPELHGMVLAGGQDDLAIRAESDLPDLPLV